MSMPNIILCGSSGVGKTTLATQLAEEFGYKFVKTNTRELEVKHGGRDKINSNLGTRCAFQLDVAMTTSNMLSCAIGDWSAKNNPFVSDRGIDFLMYECIYGGYPAFTLRSIWVQQLMRLLKNESLNTKIVLLSRGSVESQSESWWSTPSPHKYYTREETLKQEAVLEAILKILDIPHEKVQQDQIEDKVKTPLRIMQTRLKSETK